MCSDLLVVGGNFEIHQLSAEAAGLPCAEGDAGGHPDCSGDLCGAAQIQPQHQTDGESERGGNQVTQFLLRLSHVISQECGCVDAHEGDESAKVQHLRTQVVVQ